VKAKQGYGLKFRNLLNLSENALQVKAGRAELGKILDTFRVSISKVDYLIEK
jgi:hypothetical protein